MILVQALVAVIWGVALWGFLRLALAFQAAYEADVERGRQERLVADFERAWAHYVEAARIIRDALVPIFLVAAEVARTIAASMAVLNEAFTAAGSSIEEWSEQFQEVPQ